MYVTLSESRRELEEIVRSHEWSLDGIPIYEFTPTEDSLRPEDQYSAFYPSEVEFQDTTQSILRHVDTVQPARIVFDSISEIRLLARDSLRYRRQVQALKHFFLNRNCTVVLLDDGAPDRPDHQLQNVDFLNASRFPVRDRQSMSLKHKLGNVILSVAMSVLYLRWVRDSQSGMWVLRRSILNGMKLTSDGMAFSEEIKIEALKSDRIRFAEISIMYTSRLGEIKLNPWGDGLYNLWFLMKKRFS